MGTTGCFTPSRRRLGIRLCRSHPSVRTLSRGFRVTGVDVSQDRINRLNNNESYVHEIGLPELLRDQLNRNFFPTTQMPEDGDVFIVNVGTLFFKKMVQEFPNRNSRRSPAQPQW